MTRRLRVYPACTFGLTFSAWGTLVFLQPAVPYGTPKFLLPYAVGGLGPTIAAYVAVLATRADAPLREFHRSVFRWQVPIRWYLVAMGLPIALTLISAGLTMVVHPDDLHPVLAKPWYAFVPYFFEMVAGGGLEEFVGAELRNRNWRDAFDCRPLRGLWGLFGRSGICRSLPCPVFLSTAGTSGRSQRRSSAMP